MDIQMEAIVSFASAFNFLRKKKHKYWVMKQNKLT